LHEQPLCISLINYLHVVDFMFCYRLLVRDTGLLRSACALFFVPCAFLFFLFGFRFGFGVLLVLKPCGFDEDFQLVIEPENTVSFFGIFEMRVVSCEGYLSEGCE